MNQANVYLYLRKSRDEHDDPEVLAKHRSELLRLAAHDGFTVPTEAIFEEIGSADHIESRPVFRRLLADWERLPRSVGGAVWTTEVSRLTRGLQSQQGRVQDALARANIRHRTRSRWYDLRVPDDCTAWELEGFIARMESRNFRARIMAAWEEMLIAGRIRNGNGTYGYRWSKDEQNLIPIPEQFAILQRCCREVHHTSVKQLARTYHVPENTLLHALKNPLICGFPARRHGPRDPENPRREHYVLLPRAEWDWPEVQNDDYPHACTRAEWEAVWQAIDHRRLCRSNPDFRNGWCRQVVAFPQLPGPCRLSVYTYSRSRVTLPTYERRLGPGQHLYISRELVHTAALTALHGLFAAPERLEFLVETAREVEQSRQQRGTDDEAQALRRQLHLSRHRYQEAVDAEMDAADANLRLALSLRRRRLQDELERLQADLVRLESRSQPLAQFTDLLTELPELTRHFAPAWEKMADPQKRRLVEAVIARIEVTVTPHPRRHGREISALVLQPWAEEAHR